MATTFHICTTPASWHAPEAVHRASTVGGGRAHRTIAAAVVADARMHRRIRARYGLESYVDSRILASEDRGRTFRLLSLREREERWRLGH